MRYPILIQKISEDMVIAICPLLKDSYAVGETLDEALQLLQQKFTCFLHDPEIQLEIIPLKLQKKHYGENQQLSK